MNRNQKRQKVEEHDLILMKSLTHLVPFIGKLLSGQSPLHLPHPALRSSRVKISTHEQIAHEAIEALQPLIRDAVFDELLGLVTNPGVRHSGFSIGAASC